MSSTDAAGSTYRFVVALYVATVVTAVTVAVLAARGAAAGTVAMSAVGSWLGGTALVAAALWRVGVTRWLQPRRLYTTGRSWLPTLGGFALVAAGVAVGARGLGPAAALLVGGAAVATLGWFLRAMARNATARARLADGDVLEWRARPARSRRFAWYTAGGLFVLALVVAMFWARDWSLLGALGFGFALAARGANPTYYWLGGGTLVYGNPQVRYLLGAGDVTAVRHKPSAIRLDRRGWWPTRTMDPADLSDPEAVVASLERLASTTGAER